MKREEITAEAIRAETSIVLPPGTPLFATIDKAAELFGESPTTLRQLRLQYEDFPAGKFGQNNQKLLFDVPHCYAWFARQLGTDAGELEPLPRRRYG